MGGLLEEVELETERVWTFIIEREIEAPDRFRAIQSYRYAPRFTSMHDSFVNRTFGAFLAVSSIHFMESLQFAVPVDATDG